MRSSSSIRMEKLASRPTKEMTKSGGSQDANANYRKLKTTAILKQDVPSTHCFALGRHPKHNFPGLSSPLHVQRPFPPPLALLGYSSRSIS